MLFLHIAKQVEQKLNTKTALPLYRWTERSQVAVVMAMQAARGFFNICFVPTCAITYSASQAAEVGHQGAQGHLSVCAVQALARPAGPLRCPLACRGFQVTERVETHVGGLGTGEVARGGPHGAPWSLLRRMASP